MSASSFSTTEQEALDAYADLMIGDPSTYPENRLATPAAELEAARRRLADQQLAQNQPFSLLQYAIELALAERERELTRKGGAS